MPDRVGTVQVQFHSARQQRETAVAGMWLFLTTEVMFFGGAISVFVIYWYMYPQVWKTFSQNLSVTLGTINTAVLLTSSLFVALGVRAAHRGEVRRVAWLYGLTSLLGLCFLGIKGYEWYHEYQMGFYPGAWSYRGPMEAGGHLYFSLYFALTGLHAIHVLIGVVLMPFIGIMAVRRHYQFEQSTPVEVSGLYWHFVDLVWIFIFPLLYLVDRSI